MLLTGIQCEPFISSHKTATKDAGVPARFHLLVESGPLAWHANAARENNVRNCRFESEHTEIVSGPQNGEWPSGVTCG